jgi:hypothetical protein
MSLSRTEFRAAYLLPIACMASLAAVGALAPCLSAAADQTARLRSFEEASSYDAQSTVFAATNVGTWRLVRTPNPRGGPDAVSIMQTAETARSDVDLVGLTLRCSDTGFDVLVVLLRPFPPRTHPKVKLTSSGTTVHLEATVIPPGAAISLPAEAATLVKGSWQSSSELAIEVEDDGDATRGFISLVGLEPALSLLASNCPTR